MTETRIGIEVFGPSGEGFRLIEFLGRGAFGEVYRGVAQGSGRIVAVKLLPLDELESSDSQIALLNEIELAARIAHPNVVQILHVGDSASPVGPYIVMEYIPGGTLSSVLKARRASNSLIALEESIRMMTDIASGCQAINTELIHRDIKPDNILIEGSRLKISDFGISKVVDERTRSRTFKDGQHIRYMAPEGWESEEHVQTRCVLGRARVP